MDKNNKKENEIIDLVKNAFPDINILVTDDKGKIIYKEKNCIVDINTIKNKNSLVQ